MNTRTILTAAALLTGAAMSTPRDADAQAFTEFRDPLRGVTFYSVQISTDPMKTLQHEGSKFSETDQMTLGLSAFFFDESDTIDEYVLWLRHDGPRRWFAGSKLYPLDLVVDDTIKTPQPLHTLRPNAREAGPFIEKLEFALQPTELESVLYADNVMLELRTLLGSLEKTLSREEIDAMKLFKERVIALHDEARISAVQD